MTLCKTLGKFTKTDGEFPLWHPLQWAKNPTATIQVAVEVQVRSLALELPYAASVTLKKNKANKQKQQQNTDGKLDLAYGLWFPGPGSNKSVVG